MKYLKLFENFQEDDTLYIFDFDDTLVDSPSFEELVIRYKNGEDLPEIEILLKNSLKLIDKKLSDIHIENGKIFVKDADESIEVEGKGNYWVRKGGGLIKMVTPNKFHFLDISMPTKVKELSELYKQVQNKSIVTGRMVDLREKVIESLELFGLELPNHGLFCYPSKNDRTDRVAEWKAKTIVQLLKDTGFKKAKFYDDKPKWVKKVVLEVRKELPEVEFKGIRVH
jgi:hypothetical protein